MSPAVLWPNGEEVAMPDARWKRAEREVADLLGGVRLPNIGRGQPDVRAPGIAGQVKTMKTLPAWLIAAVDQSARDAGTGELPIVVLNHVRQGVKARRLLVVDLETLLTWRQADDVSPECLADG